MKIRIESNFVLPGMEGIDEIDLDRPRVTLRAVLEELSSKSSGRVKYIRSSTDAVDPASFVIEVNGAPNPGSRDSLEMALNDGDTVTVRISPLGGG